MMARSSIYSSIRKDYLENGSGAVHPSEPARACHNIPMDLQDLDYPPSLPSFGSFAFAYRRKTK